MIHARVKKTRMGPLLLLVLLFPACGVHTGRVRAPLFDPDLVVRGARLFLDPGLSGDGTRSCATCHPGGSQDGQTYLGATPVEVGSPGARNTPTLQGVWQTPPYLWDGSLPTMHACIERMLRVEMGGATLTPIDRSALEAYVQSIPAADRGRIEADGTPRDPVTLSTRRGFELFRSSGCEACHPPPTFSVGRSYDMGTGHLIDTPSLLGLRDSAPYGHDGRWSTIEQSLRATLQEQQIRLSERQGFELLAYLQRL